MDDLSHLEKEGIFPHNKTVMFFSRIVEIETFGGHSRYC